MPCPAFAGIGREGSAALLGELLEIGLEQLEVNRLQLLPLRVGGEDNHPLAQGTGFLEERLARRILLTEESFVISPRRFVVRVQGSHFRAVIVDALYARLGQFLKLIREGDKLIGARRVRNNPADL